MPAGFWQRLAQRTRLSGAAATIENRRTIMRTATGAAWLAAANGLFTGFIFFLFDEPVVAWLTVAVSVSYLGAWGWYAVTGTILGLAGIAVTVSTVLIVVNHLLLGGYPNSGGYLMWGITQVLIASIVFPRRVTVGLAAFLMTSGIVLGLAEPWVAATRPSPDPTLSTFLFADVLVVNLGLLGLILLSILNRLAEERKRSERLLLNVLPAEVAKELKEQGETRARRFESISVLFADIVGFTPMSASLDPEELVDRLNQIFTHFDGLAERYGCEKIRTIGDGYMAVAGVPVPSDDHAHAVARLALAMLDHVRDSSLRLRIGIHTGSAVAGVIGSSKFQYDVWGDTVNTASRMESHGLPDRIHVTEAVRAALITDFDFEPRGRTFIKGKGEMDTFFLVGDRTGR